MLQHCLTFFLQTNLKNLMRPWLSIVWCLALHLSVNTASKTFSPFFFHFCSIFILYIYCRHHCVPIACCDLETQTFIQVSFCSNTTEVWNSEQLPDSQSKLSVLLYHAFTCICLLLFFYKKKKLSK